MTIRLTGQTPNNDVYRIDAGGYTDVPTYLTLIGLWDSMPFDLLFALRVRRQATVTGVCPRCSYLEKPFHARACPAEFNALKAMLTRWSDQTPAYGRGRRLAEDPTNVVDRVEPTWQAAEFSSFNNFVR